MTTMASQITSLTVVYSIVHSDADQRKHQSSASLAYVRGIHRERWIPRTKASNAENVSIWWRHHVPYHDIFMQVKWYGTLTVPIKFVAYPVCFAHVHYSTGKQTNEMSTFELHQHFMHPIGQHNDVIKWKHFPRCRPFVREIHRSSVNSPRKSQWRGDLMFFILAWKNGYVNNRDAGDLWRHCAHYDIIVMKLNDT